MNSWSNPVGRRRLLCRNGTELDFFEGETFISMVGFLFLDTRVLGVAVPMHRDFEEVNLRFYVKRKSVDGWKRGVVFIRELVPRRAIATVARVFYGERIRPCRCAITSWIMKPASLWSMGGDAGEEMGSLRVSAAAGVTDRSPSDRTRNSLPNNTGVIPLPKRPANIAWNIRAGKSGARRQSIFRRGC